MDGRYGTHRFLTHAIRNGTASCPCISSLAFHYYSLLFSLLNASISVRLLQPQLMRWSVLFLLILTATLSITPTLSIAVESNPPPEVCMRFKYKLLNLLAFMKSSKVIVYWTYLSHKSQRQKIGSYTEQKIIAKNILQEAKDLKSEVQSSTLTHHQKHNLSFLIEVLQTKIKELQREIEIFLRGKAPPITRSQQSTALTCKFKTTSVGDTKATPRTRFAVEIVLAYLEILDAVLNLLQAEIFTATHSEELKGIAIASIDAAIQKLNGIKVKIQASLTLKPKAKKDLERLLEAHKGYGEEEEKRIIDMGGSKINHQGTQRLSTAV